MVSGECKFDMGFVVEQWRSRQRRSYRRSCWGPLGLLGAVRVYHYQMEMSSATFVEESPSSDPVAAVSKRGLGFAKGNHHKSRM